MTRTFSSSAAMASPVETGAWDCAAACVASYGAGAPAEWPNPDPETGRQGAPPEGTGAENAHVGHVSQTPGCACTWVWQRGQTVCTAF